MAQGLVAQVGAKGFAGLSLESLTLANPTTVSAFSGNLASGNVDIYTVPTGRRAACVDVAIHGTDTTRLAIKISGSYYFLTGAIITSLGLLTGRAILYIAEAGETFAINSVSGGANASINIFEFDPIILKSPKLTSLSAGDNTLYTVPAGKTASVLARSINPSNINFPDGTPSIWVWNNSGSIRQYSAFTVPSGGSSGSGNKSSGPQNQSNTIVASLMTGSALGAGDFIVVNTNSGAATQFCWMNVLEY